MKINTLMKSSLNTEIMFTFVNTQHKVKELSIVNNKQLFNSSIGSHYFLINNEKNILFIGLGKEKDLTITVFDKIINIIFNQLKNFNIHAFLLNINNLNIKFIKFIIEGLLDKNYTFNDFKLKSKHYKLERIDLVTEENKIQNITHEINIIQAISHGKNYSKYLQNLPTNICTTSYLLNETKKMLNSNNKLKLHYLSEDNMKELNMGCILGVSSASNMPSYIACLEYYGSSNKNEQPIVLVGKGLVYDTGGLSLKPSNHMKNMKMDMGGAAAVLGTLKAITELNLPINVIGVISLVDNAIGSKSYRPGDILTSMKGITIEVGNTDAEGRLVLADTLTYIEKYNPKVVIDIATLTGSIIIALGNDLTGLFSNSEKLIHTLKHAAYESNDLIFNLPLHKPYLKLLKSNVADISNIGGASASSITAALFLSQFTENYKWAHLDIAGTSSYKENCFIPNGRPIPLLTQYIINQIKD